MFDRIAELDRRMIELEAFREKLERIQEGKDREARIHVRWKSKEEQPKGWRPDINDGVKINMAPWERLGLFPVKKDRRQGGDGRVERTMNRGSG